MGATTSPRRPGPLPEAPRGEPDVPGDFGQAPSACGVDQMSRVSRARFRGTTGSTGCPGPLGPVSEVPRVRPAVSGDQGQGPWAHGVDLLSRALGSGSEGPWGRPGVLGVSGLCPRALGVHQLSRATRTVPEGAGVEQLPLATRACVQGPLGSTSGPGRLRTDSRDRGVDHRSQATRAGAQGPAVSTISPGPLRFWSKVLRLTSCPGRPGPMPEGTRGRPDVPGDSGQAPSACGVDRLSRGSRARVRGPERSTDCPMGIGPLPKGPWGPPAVPGHSRLGPKALGVDELPQETPARLRVPVVSPSCPGELGANPEGLRSPPVVPGDSDRTRGPGCRRAVLGDPRMCPGTRGQPAIPGDLGWSPMSRGVEQLSRATRGLFGGTAVSTSCPGRLGPRPEGPLCPPAVPCDTGRVRRPVGRPAPPGELHCSPSARGDDQLSRGPRARVRGPSVSTSCPVRIGPGSEAPRA